MCSHQPTAIRVYVFVVNGRYCGGCVRAWTWRTRAPRSKASRIPGHMSSSDDTSTIGSEVRARRTRSTTSMESTSFCSFRPRTSRGVTSHRGCGHSSPLMNGAVPATAHCDGRAQPVNGGRAHARPAGNERRRKVCVRATLVADERARKFHRHTHAHGADAVRYRHAQRKLALDFRNETLRPSRQPGAVKPASIETATYRAFAGAPPDTDAVQEPRGEVPQAPPPETNVVVVYEHDHVTAPVRRATRRRPTRCGTASTRYAGTGCRGRSPGSPSSSRRRGSCARAPRIPRPPG